MAVVVGLAVIGVSLISGSGGPLRSLAQQPTATPTDCPQPADPRVTAAALQRFERGWMAWFADIDEIWVLHDPSGEGFGGTVERYEDAWAEGMPETDPNIKPPSGLYQPTRGFGEIWRNNPTVRENLGWGLEKQQGFTTLAEVRGEKTWFSGKNLDVFAVSGDRWERIDVYRK